MRTFRGGRRASAAVAGFTLAEAAVTIAIVAIVLLMVVQGLESAKSSAYYTKVHKTAYELGITLLGEVRSGIYREELDSGLSGNFADRDEPAYTWEILLGEDVFEDAGDDEERGFDNFADRRRRREEREESDSVAAENDEEAEEPFEKIKVRVVFPVLNDDRPNELILEAWVPWEEVYGPSEEDEALPAAGDPAAGAGGAGGAAGAGGTAGTAGTAGRGDTK